MNTGAPGSYPGYPPPPNGPGYPQNPGFPHQAIQPSNHPHAPQPPQHYDSQRTFMQPSGVRPSGVRPSGVRPSGVRPSGVRPSGAAHSSLSHSQYSHPGLQQSTGPLGPQSYLGPYQIVEEIGRGGMGIVYKARHHQLQRLVALKVLIAGEDASEEAIVRFLREAESVARLGHHPHIVPVYDMGCQGRMHYFAMHFVEGRPLDKLIELGEVAPLRAAILTEKVAQGLSHAHSHNILHRDIKPENILVDKDGEPKIGDFGLAKDVAEGEGLTRTGSAMGTPSYMSPEQADGDPSAIDARSDVYSLGASLYEMLTGEPPFKGQTMLATLNKVLTQDPVEPRKVNPGIPKDLESICLKCLDKEPERRYQSAEELSEDLQRFLNSEPVAAQPITAARRLRLWLKRNKSLAVMASTALVAVLLSLVLAARFLILKPYFERRALAQRQALIKERSRAYLDSELQRLRRGMTSSAVPAAEVLAAANKEALTERMQQALKDLSVSATEQPLLTAAIEAAPREALAAEAAYALQRWPLAFRMDPFGVWGARALVKMSVGQLRSRRYSVARNLLIRALSRCADFPLSEDWKAEDRAVLETQILELLVQTLKQTGEIQLLASALEQLKTTRGSLGAAEKRLQAFLESIYERRQSLMLGAISRAGQSASARELVILELDTPILALPARKGRPVFAIKDGLFKRLKTGPFDGLPSTDRIVAVRAADFDKDGAKEIMVALHRPSVGGGLIILKQRAGQWHRVFERLDNIAAPMQLAIGAMSAPGRPEALLIFQYQSHEQWHIAYQQGWRVTPFVPPLNSRAERPWCFGTHIADLNGDGRAEVILGRSVQINGEFQALQWTGKSLKLMSEIIIGQTRATIRDQRGWVAAVIHNDKDYSRRYKNFEFETASDGLALLRFENNDWLLKHWYPFSFNTAREFEAGTVVEGRLGGQDSLAWHSYVHESQNLSSGDKTRLTYSGQRMQFLVGEPKPSHLTSLGVQRTLEGLLLRDLDGDGESELITVSKVNSGLSELVVRGRRQSEYRPLIQTQEESEGAEGERLLRSAADLVSTGRFAAARDMYFDIAQRLRGQATSTVATERALKTFLSEGQKLESRLERMNVLVKNPKLRDQQETEKRRQYQELKARVQSHTQHARRKTQELLESAALTLLEKQHAASILVEIARRSEDWSLYAQALKRFESYGGHSEHYPSVDQAEQLAAWCQEDFSITGAALLKPEYPLVTEAPWRFSKRDGQAVFTLDPHSARLVLGIPIDYKSGSFDWDIEFQFENSAWDVRGQLGLMPRHRLMSLRQDPQRGSEGFNAYLGSVNFHLHNTRNWNTAGPRFSNIPNGWTDNQCPWTEQRRIRARYYPEAKTWFVSIYRRSFGESEYQLVTQRRGTFKGMPAGQYVLGLSCYHFYGDGQYHNAIHPARVRLFINSMRFKATNAEVDTRLQWDDRSLVQRGGGHMLRGQDQAAQRCFTRALSLNHCNQYARIYLAYLTGDSKYLADGLTVDAYSFILVLDDITRGCQKSVRLRLGQLLRPLTQQWPGLINALMGERDKALPHLKGSHPAHRYARIRLLGPSYGKDFSWLCSRDLRTPGTELQDIFWAPPSPDFEAESLRLGQRAKDREGVLRNWFQSCQYLLCTGNQHQAHIFRAQIGQRMQRHAVVWENYRDAAEIKGASHRAWEDIALLSGSYGDATFAAQWLDKALKAGVSRSLLNHTRFHSFQSTPQFKKLRKKYP